MAKVFRLTYKAIFKKKKFHHTIGMTNFGLSLRLKTLTKFAFVNYESRSQLKTGIIISYYQKEQTYKYWQGLTKFIRNSKLRLGLSN